MGIAIVVFGIALTQISFLHVNNFISKKIKHYRLVYKSLGFWVEASPSPKSQETNFAEIYEWDDTMNPKLLDKRLIVRFKGQIYLKVLRNTSYFMMNNKRANFVDILILVFLKGIISTKGLNHTRFAFL